MSEESRKALNFKMDIDVYKQPFNFISYKKIKNMDIKTIPSHFRIGYNRAARLLGAFA
ncbi:hypothetical protein IG612_01235 [Pectobacterium sp. FL60-S17]|uniref:hypothetical protein n=1 Tax=Pectobacterium quasiaquaticum TaxID=2774015 RepID=UPI001873DC26|nr:hypothetical protein [Pectobacterium quasiaquaticum]MBE5201263.1 hypothetical protein [Pectobacterium quasiaquaticum]MBE5209748.1 hypothetical protein [Pectobacterium quasiaquaticum]